MRWSQPRAGKRDEIVPVVSGEVLHKCCLKITFRDFSPPSVIEIPRDFFVDVRNCIPRVCVKILSQKNKKRMRHFEKNQIFRAHCQVSRSAAQLDLFLNSLISPHPNWGPRPTHTLCPRLHLGRHADILLHDGGRLCAIAAFPSFFLSFLLSSPGGPR